MVLCKVKKYGVVMAGGGGTRFWPLSRQKTPKQLINLTGNGLMINETIDRMAYTVANDDIFIVTSAVQASAMKQATNGRIRSDHILAEPAARNTAACIGYAATEITTKYGDGIMLITPSDHYIRDVQTLTRTFSQAIEVAEEQDKLITIGIRPDYPATGFGYIKFDKYAPDSVRMVEQFREKPDEETAKAYLLSGEYAWNSGMFIWKASSILDRFKKYIPDVYEDLIKIGNAMGTEQEKTIIEQVYPNIRKISIDYAIMEPAAASGEVMVIPAEFGWNDVGSWDMMTVLNNVDENGNVLIGDTLTINSENNIAYSTEKLIAMVDVSDLIVVEADDAILICPKNKAQNVRFVVDELTRINRYDLL